MSHDASRAGLHNLLVASHSRRHHCASDRVRVTSRLRHPLPGP